MLQIECVTQIAHRIIDNFLPRCSNHPDKDRGSTGALTEETLMNSRTRQNNSVCMPYRHISLACALQKSWPTGSYLKMATLLIEACAISLLALPAAQAQTAIYLDPTQPIETRIADLLPRLTPQQKVGQMFAYAPAIPALQIPVMNGWNQMAHGCVWNQPTTMF